MKHRAVEQCIWLTQEEAIGLLELVMVSPNELTQEQRSAFMKLSECCRRALSDADTLNDREKRTETRATSECAA